MSMRTWALCGSLLSAMALATSAHAACTATTIGNITWLQGTSDNSCADIDDLPMFVDAAQNVSTINGSLNKNNNAFQNITTSANADFFTDGNGFANLKSEDQGNKPNTNTLTEFTFVPGSSITLPTGEPFPGFDGTLIRGQIDDVSGFNGDVNVTVNFTGGGSATHTFSAVDEGDIGALGFDEAPGSSYFVSSVVFSLDGTGGAWNQVKQMEFSVPGAITTIPEASTWAMMLLGFVGLGFGAFRRSRKGDITIVSA